MAVTAAGWATYNELGGEWLEELHEAAAKLMLLLVGVHVAAVALGSWLHKDNLVAAMVSGRKPGRPEDGVRSAWRAVAALMLAAVIGFWWTQWRNAPSGAVLAERAAATQEDHDGRHD
jgi:hypothetical protein